MGPEYELSRHNAGFLVADRLASLHKTEFTTSRLSMSATIKYKGKSIHIIKPTTYMNLSGKAVNYWLQKLQIPVENLLVIVDDIALPFGKLRLREKGSSAGHNGLIDIEEHLGTQEYSRLRIGIGDDFIKGEQIKYVLSRFNPEEIKLLDDILTTSCEIIYSVVTIGMSRSMSTFNKK